MMLLVSYSCLTHVFEIVHHHVAMSSHTSLFFCYLDSLDGKNGGSGGGAGTSSAASGGQSELLGAGLGSSGGTSSSAGA